MITMLKPRHFTVIAFVALCLGFSIFGAAHSAGTGGGIGPGGGSSSGSSGVSTFNGRSGTVVPASNDYSFAQLSGIPTTVSGYGCTDCVKTTNNGSDFSSASTVRTNLGLAIGTNVEAWDADLDCIAALSGVGFLKHTGAGTCSSVALALSDISDGSTVALKANNLSVFAATTSAQLAALISDESGTGALLFAGGNFGVEGGTSLALAGCTIGTDGLCVTGTMSVSGAASFGGTVTASNITSSTNLQLGSAGIAFWNARTAIRSPSDGVLELTNNGATDFARLQLGGITSAFPSIKRSGTSVALRLADDSGDAPLTAGTTTLSGTIRTTGTIPTVTGTGSPTITTGSTDTAGEVTGGTLATSIVITFSATKTNAPFCTISAQTMNVITGYTITTTAITISETASTGQVVDYHCFQR